MSITIYLVKTQKRLHRSLIKNKKSYHSQRDISSRPMVTDEGALSSKTQNNFKTDL